jgi:hypothetical protein
MTIKMEIAKKWGGTITIPMTSFLEENKRYVIQDAKLNDEDVVIIKESKDNDKLMLKTE